MFLDKVVIGNSLKSLEFTKKENATLIRNRLTSPPIFEKQKGEWHKRLFHLGLSGKDIYHGVIGLPLSFLLILVETALILQTLDFLPSGLILNTFTDNLQEHKQLFEN